MEGKFATQSVTVWASLASALVSVIAISFHLAPDQATALTGLAVGAVNTTALTITAVCAVLTLWGRLRATCQIIGWWKPKVPKP